MASTRTETLDHVINPKHRKGATEEHIFADNQKARTTAMLLGAKSNKEKLRLAARRSRQEGSAGE